MAQSGFTPLQMYASSTGGNVPTTGNLTNSASGSELAINIADGKLFYKDNVGVVQVIATKAAAAGTFINLSVSGTATAPTITPSSDSSTNVATTAFVQSAIGSVQGVPSGSVFHFAASTAPTGYLYCNGAAVSRTTYAALFAVTGTTFGVGDGTTTFNLPDLRGEFVRGWNNQPSTGLDPARVFGSLQTDIIKNHTHPASTTASDAGHNHGYVTLSGGGGSSFAGGAQGTTTATTDIGFASISASTTISNNTGGSATETRPVNVALLPCIKT